MLWLLNYSSFVFVSLLRTASTDNLFRDYSAMTLYTADAASAATSSAVDVASALAWHSASAVETAPGLAHTILDMPLCAAGRL